MTIRAVVFDVGECLVDETREYGTWADWLQVPRHTFVAQFGAVIAEGRDYRETFQIFAPGFDLYEQREARIDVLPALDAGMRTALIRRGPWGWIQQHDPAAQKSTFRIDSLAELPEPAKN
ncbi:hypothetical protein [Kitasatospora sp. P5_F3]